MAISWKKIRLFSFCLRFLSFPVRSNCRNINIYSSIVQYIFHIINSIINIRLNAILAYCKNKKKKKKTVRIRKTLNRYNFEDSDFCRASERPLEARYIAL